MTRAHPSIMNVACATLVILLGSPSAFTQVDRPRPSKIDPPRFTDPARRAKLSSAFGEIDRVFRDFSSRAPVPGSAWGIVIDGELAHTGTTGYRELATKSPVTPDTVFRIASMTKSFTAMAILKLRDEGKLSLDDPVERYVEELRSLRYPTADSPRITIRHLLSHAEGFPEDNAWGDRHLADTDDQLSQMLRLGIPFSNAPGVAYEYSNYGFAILGQVVARVSGRSYGDYVTTNLLRPLRMNSTTLEPSAVPAARLAHGYRWEEGQWTEEQLLANGAFGAMGGMLTSVPDLARYVAVLMAAWPPRDDPETGPIRRSSLREMQQVWRSQAAAVTRKSANGEIELNAGGYGFGLRIFQTCDFGHVVVHGGGLPGFGSYMRWLPEYGVGIISFNNLTYAGGGGAVAHAFDLLSKTGGLQPRETQPSLSLIQARDAVSRLIARWSDQEADQIAADNFFLDRAREQRRLEFEVLRSQLGTCTNDPNFDFVENALRGEWTMTCERGRLRAAITLAPTMTPRIQVLEIARAQTSDGRRQSRACAQ